MEKTFDTGLPGHKVIKTGDLPKISRSCSSARLGDIFDLVPYTQTPQAQQKNLLPTRKPQPRHYSPDQTTD